MKCLKIKRWSKYLKFWSSILLHVFMCSQHVSHPPFTIHGWCMHHDLLFWWKFILVFCNDIATTNVSPLFPVDDFGSSNNLVWSKSTRDRLSSLLAILWAWWCRVHAYISWCDSIKYGGRYTMVPPSQYKKLTDDQLNWDNKIKMSKKFGYCSSRLFLWFIAVLLFFYCFCRLPY